MPPPSSSGWAVNIIRLARGCNARSQRAMPAGPRSGADGLASGIAIAIAITDGEGCGAWLSPRKIGIRSRIPQSAGMRNDFVIATGYTMPDHASAAVLLVTG